MFEMFWAAASARANFQLSRVHVEADNSRARLISRKIDLKAADRTSNFHAPR
jgi:hypothetical protein